MSTSNRDRRASEVAVELALQELERLRDGPLGPLRECLDWLALWLTRGFTFHDPLMKTGLALLAGDEDFVCERCDWPIPAAVLREGDRSAAKYQVVRKELCNFLWHEAPPVKLETALEWASLPRSRWLKNGVFTLMKQRLAPPRLQAEDPLLEASSLDRPGAADVLLGPGALDALRAVEVQDPALETLNGYCEYLGEHLTDRECQYLILWDPAGENRNNREVCALMGVSEGAGAGRRGIRTRVEKKLAKAAGGAM